MTETTSTLERHLSKEYGWTRRVLRSLRAAARRHPFGVVVGLVLAVVIFAALFAGFITSYDPSKVVPLERFQAPNRTHWLGTDELGRDTFARVLFGGRVSLYVSLFAVVMVQVIGVFVGLVSGYLGGLLDSVMQRFIDALQSIPLIVLLIAVVTALGPSATNLALAIGLVAWSSTARIIRSQVLAAKQMQYVEAAAASGAGPLRVVLKHIAPQIWNLVIVLASSQLGAYILAESSISYLGFGVPPTTPSWGTMMSGAARDYVLIHPWTAISAGMAITLSVLSLNLVGDVLRDELDPRSR